MVIPPSRQDSLKRRRKVPGSLSLNKSFSRSLLKNPIIYLYICKEKNMIKLDWITMSKKFLCSWQFQYYNLEYSFREWRFWHTIMLFRVSWLKAASYIFCVNQIFKEKKSRMGLDFILLWIAWIVKSGSYISKWSKQRLQTWFEVIATSGYFMANKGYTLEKQYSSTQYKIQQWNKAIIKQSCVHKIL